MEAHKWAVECRVAPPPCVCFPAIRFFPHPHKDSAASLPEHDLMDDEPSSHLICSRMTFSSSSETPSFGCFCSLVNCLQGFRPWCTYWCGTPACFTPLRIAWLPSDEPIEPDLNVSVIGETTSALDSGFEALPFSGPKTSVV